MATKLGSSAVGTGTSEWNASPYDNVIGGALTLPAGGPWLITRVGVYMGGKDANATTKLCLYSTSGTLLRAAASTFEAAGNPLWNPGAAYEQDLSSPYQVNGGTTVVVAFVCDPADARQWRDENNSNTQYFDVAGSAASPANVSWNTSTQGHPPICLYYTPAAPTVYVRRGGVWVQNTQIYVRRSGAWVQQGETAVRRSGAWHAL